MTQEKCRCGEFVPAEVAEVVTEDKALYTSTGLYGEIICVPNIVKWNCNRFKCKCGELWANLEMRVQNAKWFSHARHLPN